MATETEKTNSEAKTEEESQKNPSRDLDENPNLAPNQEQNQKSNHNRPHVCGGNLEIWENYSLSGHKTKIKYPPYFLHEKPWTEFWVLANSWIDPVHQYFRVDLPIDFSKNYHNPYTRGKLEDRKVGIESKLEMQAIIYQYPWLSGEFRLFGQKFWYLPRVGAIANLYNDKVDNGTEINTQQLQQATYYTFKDILSIIIIKAEQAGINHIKLDIDDQFASLLEIKTKNKLLYFVRRSIPSKYEAVIATKNIQYLQTMTLDLQTLPEIPSILITAQDMKQRAITELKREQYQYFDADLPKDELDKLATEMIKEKYDYQLIESGQRRFSDVESDSLEDIMVIEKFFENSKDFWATTSQKVRRYTRKAIAVAKTENWKIEVVQGGQNSKSDFDSKRKIEAFNFFYNEYVATSTRQNFVIQPREYLRDLFKQDFCYIIIIKDNWGEVLSVWMGIQSQKTLTYLYGGNSQQGLDEHSQYLIQLVAIGLGVSLNKKFYDLGGYDKTKGFGQFKDGYGGQIRDFVGVVDIVLKPKIYGFLNRVRSFLKRAG